MERIHYFLVLGLAAGTDLQAQFFMEAHGSYLMPIGGLTMVESTPGSDEAINYNAGSGVGGGLVLGTRFASGLGIEARVTYMSGDELSLKHQGTNSSSSGTFKSHYIRIDPALRISTAGSGSVQPYVAFGPSLAVASKLAYTNEYTYSNFDPWSGTMNTQNSTYQEDLSGGIGFGGFGAAGVVFGKPEAAVGFFAEVQFSALSWAPREGAYTETSYGNNPSSGPYSSSGSGTINYEERVNDGTEDEALRLSFPMSTWGARAGVRFSFGS